MLLPVTHNPNPNPNPNIAFPALAHHIDSLLGEPPRPVVVLGDFNHTHAHPLLHNIMVGELDAHPLLCNGEVTFPRTNTGPDNIFASPSLAMAANATILDIQQGDHHPVVATFKRLFPTAAPHGHLADDADQPPHIRWWRLRRPADKFDKRGLASYNKAVAAAQAEARPLLDQQEELDLESLQDALLGIFTNVLGTAPEHSETTETWMNDPIFKDYLLLHKQAVKRHNRRRTAANATARNQALKRLRWAKIQAITKARLATIQRISQRDPTAFFRDQKQRREPRTDTACPHLNRQATVAAWSNILQRPAAHEGTAAGAMPPLTDSITLTFESTDDNDEVLAAISRTKYKSSGPDGLDARGVKVLAPVLYPLYQLLFNKAVQNSLPPALKRGRTGLIAKADKTSTDPLKYRPITTLPILTRMFHSAIDHKLRELV